MSDPRITDKVVGVAFAAFTSDKFAHPVQAMRAALDAAAPLLAPQSVDPQALAALLRKHQVGAFAGEDTACYCDRKWRKNDAYREHLRDAVLALLNGSAK
jgi:hypothetical protein